MTVATVAEVVAVVGALAIRAALTFGVFRLLGEQHKETGSRTRKRGSRPWCFTSQPRVCPLRRIA
jgi:hypothetical protein